MTAALIWLALGRALAAQECVAYAVRLTPAGRIRSGDPEDFATFVPPADFRVVGVGGHYVVGLDAYAVVLACREVPTTPPPRPAGVEP